MAQSIDSFGVPAGATAEQLLEKFDRYGVILCRDLVAKEDIGRLRQCVGDLTAMQSRATGRTVGSSDRPDIMELEAVDHGLAAGVYDTVNSHPEVFRLAGSDALRNVADVLIHRQLSNELIVSGFQLRMDLPNNRSELLSWHRDCDYFSHFPIEGVVAWIPLYDIAGESGGISVVPQILPIEDLEAIELHKEWPGRRKPHRVFEIANADVVLSKLAEPVKVECKAGDALFFSLSTVHRSEPNRSHQARWTLQYRYFSASAAARSKLDRAALSLQ